MLAASPALMRTFPAEAREDKQGYKPAFGSSQVLPDDPRYNSLRFGFNQRFKGDPAYIEVVGTAQDALAATRRALGEGKRVTVRGGGHCYENFVSYNTGGVIIDLSALNGVYVEPDAPDTVVIEGGCTLFNVYTQLFKQWNRTIPAGSCYSVGAGGHICGGGYGLLSRLHGLTVDYLYGVEIITIDEGGAPRLHKVTREDKGEREQNLYWAVRGGGGGNFGIITKYLYKLDEIPAPPENVYYVSYAWDWSRMSRGQFADLLAAYGGYFSEYHAPGQEQNRLFALLHLTTFVSSQLSLTVQVAGGDQVALDIWEQFNGRLLEAAHEPVVRTTAIPFHAPPGGPTNIRRMPWIEATQTLDGVGANQRGKYKSTYMLKPFPGDQVDTIYRFLSDPNYNNPQALLQVDSYGGQINATAPDATAVAQRSSIMKLQYQTYWTHPRGDGYNIGWINDFYRQVYAGYPNNEPVPDDIVDGCYINYPDV
ncbi:MAG: FAD-binding protein, partial [Pseudomonadota bacterium]